MEPGPFSAAILAGGASRRFGSNKALAPISGEPLVARVAKLLRPLSEDLFLVTNDPAPYAFLNLAVHPDARPGYGPLSGLHAALVAARHDWVFLAACDMPLLSPPLVLALAAARSSRPAVVPASARGVEPLHAFYSKACLPQVEAALERGELGLQKLLSRLGASVLPYPEVKEIAGNADPFENVNTSADYDRLVR